MTTLQKIYSWTLGREIEIITFDMDYGTNEVSAMYPFPVTQFDEEMLIAGPAGTEIIALEESSSAVLAEVHHTVAFDADKAWEAMRALSRGA